MMSEQPINGLAVHSMHFGDYDQLVTVFTEELGMIKLIIKGAYRSKKNNAAAVEPLTLAQWMIIPGRGDLAKCKEVSPINRHLHLRDDWLALQAAGTMIKALLHTQQPHRPAPLLYRLLIGYLDKMGRKGYPETLATSFLLKLLYHEGVFQPTPHCKVCQTELSELMLHEGQCYCKLHAPHGAYHLTGQESDLLLLLTYGRSISSISAMPLSSEFQNKIQQLFHELMD